MTVAPTRSAEPVLGDLGELARRGRGRGSPRSAAPAFSSGSTPVPPATTVAAGLSCALGERVGEAVRLEDSDRTTVIEASTPLDSRVTVGAVGANDTPTVFEWAGGEEAFRRWLDTFYDLVEGDELLAPIFGGVVTEEHRDHVTAWWAEVMGGPARYTQELGGYEHMLARHRDLAITPEQRLRFVTLLSRGGGRRRRCPADPRVPGGGRRLRGMGLPAGDAELRARSRRRGPCPRPRAWGWGVAPPYRG